MPFEFFGARRKVVIAMAHIGALPGTPLFDAEGGMTRLIAQSHEMAQQLINHLAHEAEQSIGVRCGEHVVEMQVLLPLRTSLSGARGSRRADVDAVLQRFEVRVGEMRDGASGELGFEHSPDRVDLRHVEVAKEKVVLHKLEGAFEWHFADRGAARRAGAHRDQALDFERLERFARRSLADAEQLLQSGFLGQLVTRYEPPRADPALDLFNDHVATFLRTEATLHLHLTYLS